MERVPFDPAAPSPAGASADGTAHLLIESQENVGEGATFFRYGRRLQGAAAVSANSELSLVWDPSYQALTLHEVTLYRDGVRRNALHPEKVRVLEREAELEAKVLDGRLSAVVVLEDVRPGDVLEYSFTRAGRNPIFGSRWSSSLWTGSTVPVGRIRRRVVLPPGRDPVRRSYAGAPEPAERALDRGRELLWDLADVRATIVDDHLPPDVEVVPRVQLSEWASWGDVAAWGAGNFLAPTGAVPKDVVERLRKPGQTPAQAAVDALRFVQGEVRYLGIEMGASSHAPAQPDEVLRRRFGDCKDKALLLVAILRALGIQADAALVSLDDGRAVGRFLPAPDVFDHAIVRVRLGSEDFWLDPTLRQRRGALADLVHADVGKALVLADGARDLVDVPAVPIRLARRTVRDVFLIPPKGPATFTVTTVATGFGADALREDWVGMRPADIEKNCLEFYTKRYPGIRATSAPELRDDAADGSVTTVEHYAIDNLFRGDPREADFYPQDVRDRVVQIVAPGRKTPYALPFPAETIETVEITFPGDWYVAPVSASLRNPWLDYSVRSESRPRGAVLTWQLRYRAAAVPAADIRRFADDVRSLLDQLGFTLPWGGDPRPRVGLERVNWPVVLASALFAVVLSFLVFKVLIGSPRSPAPPRLEDAPYEGLGGWLVLVGFGVIVRPLTLVATVVSEQKGLFDVEAWETYTAPHQHRALSALVLAELGVNLILLALGVAVAVAFFRKMRRFVPLFAAQLVALPIVLGLDDVAAHAVLGTTGSKASVQAAGMIVPVLLWLWYLARSRRVRATFTR